MTAPFIWLFDVAVQSYEFDRLMFGFLIFRDKEGLCPFVASAQIQIVYEAHARRGGNRPEQERGNRDG